MMNKTKLFLFRYLRTKSIIGENVSPPTKIMNLEKNINYNILFTTIVATH